MVDGRTVSLREPGHEHRHTIEMSAHGPVVLADLSAGYSYAGAASNGGADGSNFERLEARGFALFLENLVARYDPRRAEDDPGDYAKANKERLLAIINDAKNTVVELRPRFKDICHRLSRIE